MARKAIAAVVGFSLASAPLLRAVLGSVALAMAGGIHAAGLFLPLGPSDAAIAVAPAATFPAVRRVSAEAPAAWERHVRVARHELAAARNDVEGAGAGRLQLNVRDGVRLDVVVERTAPTKWGYSLSGRVAGGEVGFVTLVVHEEAIAGSIWTPNAAYELRHFGGGIHAIRDASNAPPFHCAGVSPDEPPRITRDRSVLSDTDGISVVDIFVVWSSDQTIELSQIDMLIAYMNDALERSGAFVTLNLIAAEQADHTGSELDNDAGVVDEVQNRGDTLGADLIHIVTPSLGASAGLSGPLSWSNGSPQIFAHEIGHNFGVNHEKLEFHGGGDGSFFYSYGFNALSRSVQDGSIGSLSCYSTLMSYGLGCSADPIPYFGSPWRYSPLEGSAFGTNRFSRDRSVRGAADAVLTINRNGRVIANRNPRQGGNR